MHCVKILLDRSVNKEEHPCHSLIPVKISAKGVEVKIQACSMLNEGAGYSIIQVVDPSDSMPEGHFEYPYGECNVTKVSRMRYSAFVLNRKCVLSSLINAAGCFLSSAVPRTDTIIEWTIIGPSSSAIHALLKNMRDAGYKFDTLSSEALVTESILTPKQEEYFNKAYDLGYYDVPKRIGLDGLSKIFGCSKSTLNVALRSAEMNIFRFYRDSYGGTK